jgi:hypothetical protein
MRQQRQQQNTSKVLVNGWIIRKIGRGVWQLSNRGAGHNFTGGKAKVTSDAYELEEGPYTREDLT